MSAALMRRLDRMLQQVADRRWRWAMTLPGESVEQARQRLGNPQNLILIVEEFAE